MQLLFVLFMYYDLYAFLPDADFKILDIRHEFKF